jgi:hypothetical protein
MELVRRLFVRAGILGLLFYASCGGRTTLVDLSEQAAGEGAVGGTTGGKGGSGGKGGRGGTGGAGDVSGGTGGATGGVGGATGGAGGGPAGTGGMDVCPPGRCKNGGLCFQATGGWACRCPAGTFGDDCSGNVNECDPNPCVNGVCEDLIGRFNCDCDPGFAGQFCEISVNECEPNPCLNGGNCIDRGDGFVCECEDGWAGQRCELQEDPCNPNPCENGGVCIDRMMGFLCACPAGFTGDRCQTPTGDECQPNPCLNGGTCKAQGGGMFTCECAAGFAPPLCQCHAGDVPQSDGACVLSTVCGNPLPEALAGGDCSDNTAEFANWWCQLAGYAEAASYTTVTTGVFDSLYYSGGVEEVLSTCAQVTGPSAYGYQTYCTGVDNLACRGSVTNALRPVLMACGNPSRDPRTFIPPGSNLGYAAGCAPGSSTQAFMITRNGFPLVDDEQLRSYLNAGGIVITEYNASDEVWSRVFPDTFQSMQQLGSCNDNVPAVVQFSPSDQFWIDNAFPMIVSSQTGCGFSVAHFPYLTPLAGWDAVNVALGYRNIGQGRFYAADFDWQDEDQNQPSLPALLGYMITHRR